MRNHISPVAVALVAVAVTPCAAVAEDLPASGLYQMTATVAYGGGHSQTHTREECILTEQFKDDPQAMMNQQQQPPGQECAIDEWTVADGKLSMRMSCTIAEGSATIVGNGEYSSNSFSMVNKMSIKSAQMNMEVTTTTKGKRQRDC